MICSPFRLFTEITPFTCPVPHAFERPKLKNLFTLNKDEVVLTLTEQYLAYHSSATHSTPTHLVPLTFDLKFEIIYESLPVHCLSLRIKTASESPSPSSSNAKGVPSNSPFKSAIPPSQIGGLSNSKRKSIRGTSTNSSRPRKRLEKEPSPRCTWLKGSETTKWSQSRPFRRRSSTLEKKARNL